MKHHGKHIPQILKKPWLPYVAPFVLFLLLTEPGRFFPDAVPYLYIVKTFFVAALLWFWRHAYAKDFSDGLTSSELLTSIGCGLLVLVLWIVPEGYLFQLDQKTIFDPQGLGESQAAIIGWIGIRLLGASLVVPIMEELFWRSFLMRDLIEPDDFRSVPMGAFTWLSFLGVAIFFGLEHNRIGAGIVAGLLYGLLLVRQKNLKGVVLAHMVTNLGLGLYVIVTGSWWFW
ncbi:MAG: CAAX prenyl protease-related protein [Desulfobulbaceae bacterium]|nr:CAAX prenyl protease-related protein [Desulfobulbaceae bacterium]